MSKDLDRLSPERVTAIIETVVKQFFGPAVHDQIARKVSDDLYPTLRDAVLAEVRMAARHEARDAVREMIGSEIMLRIGTP